MRQTYNNFVVGMASCEALLPQMNKAGHCSSLFHHIAIQKKRNKNLEVLSYYRMSDGLGLIRKETFRRVESKLQIRACGDGKSFFWQSRFCDPSQTRIQALWCVLGNYFIWNLCLLWCEETMDEPMPESRSTFLYTLDPEMVPFSNLPWGFSSR